MKTYYELIFEVTKICANGNERRTKKSVYTTNFYGTEAEIISKAIAVLKANHFYNIKHIGTKNAQLLFVD